MIPDNTSVGLHLKFDIAGINYQHSVAVKPLENIRNEVIASQKKLIPFLADFSKFDSCSNLLRILRIPVDFILTSPKFTCLL